jgi:hypothetical protein
MKVSLKIDLAKKQESLTNLPGLLREGDKPYGQAVRKE